MQVPLARRPVGLGHSSPRSAAKDGLPVVGCLVAVHASAVTEEVAVAFRRARRGGEGLLEPGVAAARVIGHQVNDDAQPQLVGAGHQSVKVVQGAKERVDAAVVGHVVAGVALGGGHEGREPHGVNAELLEHVESGDDACQVANTVAVGVEEGAGIDLINHGGAPPFRARGRRRGGREDSCRGRGIGGGCSHVGHDNQQVAQSANVFMATPLEGVNVVEVTRDCVQHSGEPSMKTFADWPKLRGSSRPAGPGRHP